MTATAQIPLSVKTSNMAQVHPRGGTGQKQYWFSEGIAERLETRKGETDVPVSAQIRRAVERYLKLPSDPLLRLLTTDHEVRKPATLSEEINSDLKIRKKKTRLDLNEQVQIAVSLYLLVEDGQIPGIEPSIAEQIASTLGPALTQSSPKNRFDPEVESKLRELGVTLGMPSTVSSKDVVPRLITISNDVVVGGVHVLRLPDQPGGPWRESLENGEVFVLPKFIADMIGAQEGDLMFPVKGESMKEAGIPDKSTVIMRSLEGTIPADGSIVLACAPRNNGRYFYTVKHWFRDRSGRAELRNGKLEVFSLPKDVRSEELQPVARLVGIMGQAAPGATVKGTRPREERMGARWETPENE